MSKIDRDIVYEGSQDRFLCYFFSFSVRVTTYNISSQSYITNDVITHKPNEENP